MLRQAARSAAWAALGAGFGALIAACFAFFLPWWLLGASWQFATPALVCAIGAGAACGIWRGFAGWRWPSDVDCALLAETGAGNTVSTALGLRDDDAFAPPVLSHAQQAVGARRDLNLAPAVSTRHLIAAPLLALGAAIAVMGGYRLTPDASPRPDVAAREKPSTSSVSAASAISAADLQAYEQAMGLRKSQAALENLANDLRDGKKSDADRQKSLDAARQAAGKTSTSTGADLPERVPATKEAREELAKRVERAANAAGSKAAALEQGKGAATTDGGGDVKGSADTRRAMEPFPAYQAREFADASEALSDQSAERRAFAQAAADALARIKRGQ